MRFPATPLLCCLLLIMGSSTLYAQKNDTLYRYLDSSLAFTSKKMMVYPALAIKGYNSWFLASVYPDTSYLIRAWFKDRKQEIRNGIYQLYHPKGQIAFLANYVDNVLQGAYQHWYTNGQKSDSGLVKNNRRIGNWYHWYTNGQLSGIEHYKEDVPAVAYAATPFNNLLETGLQNGIPDGLYQSWYPDGHLKDSGRYINGLKGGEWHTFFPNGQIEAKGHYLNDMLEGRWEWFRKDGLRSTIETYTGNKLSDLQCFDEQGAPAGEFCSILKEPVPAGDFNDFRSYMLDHLFWPRELPPNVQGIVRVSFTITAEGQLTNFTIVRSPHPLLSREVERFFGTLSHWYPAVFHNRVTDYPMTLEIPFLR